MLLSARILKNLTNVNSFEYDDTLQWTEGDFLDIYFQIINAEQDTAIQGYLPSGRRFMPPAGTTLTVSLESIDLARTVTRTAVQPFAEDPSIWTIPILSSDGVRGAPQFRLKLVMPTGTVYGVVKGMFRVQPKNNVCL